MPDDIRDWIDSAIADDVWEPPPGFTASVAAQARTVIPRRPAAVPFAQRLVAVGIGLRETFRARLAASAWMMAQYRGLFRIG